MPAPDSPAPEPAGRRARPVRADARRNRDHLLAVAREAFAATDGRTSLDAIAREAGVGIGTLYRHFPTREALVEAIYAAELDAVVDSVPALLAEHEQAPEAALRAWADRYAAFVAAKRGLSDTLRAGWAAGTIATPATRERLTAAIAPILDAGAASGSLRADVTPEEVTLLLLGVFLSTTAADSPHLTGPMLDLIVDAVRVAPDR
ncbi:TetR/AcrR family transcriptional regulator [Streptomyces sp. NPDC057718]|uniref:TetR/AcrR family transcriptional regulator n=1 Tax=Streptomyces sp. NPDC057718 TaxID=3346225 RepID=UPI0036C0E1E1